MTQQTGNTIVKGGTLLAGVGSGAAAGGAVGGPVGAAAGAVVGAAAGGALVHHGTKGRQQAYAAGMEDGAAKARAEQLEEQWKREAVYNAPGKEEEENGSTTVRNVYVPSRTVNGVEYPGQYQTVDIHR